MTTLIDTTNTTNLVDVAREAADRLRPSASAHDVSGEISPSAFDMLRRLGITSALVPGQHGGRGVTHRDMGAIVRELGRADPAVAVTLSMHSHLVAAQVWRHHRGMDASAVFERVVNGAILVSTGASDWVGSNGTARKVEGGYQVNARKSPASGCEVGDVLVTSIRWDDAPDGPSVLHCAVPLAADGVSIEKTWDTMGLRATGSHTVVLDNVFVPDAAIALVRPADQWHPVWNTIMGAAMPLIMAAYVGTADAAVEAALRSVRNRIDSHVFQLVGEMMNAHTTAADVLDAMFAASDNLRFENTNEHAAQMLSRKTVVAAAAIDTVRLAIELVGGAAYSRGSDLERLYRDVHGALFHPLPKAKQQQFSGRITLGHAPIE